MFLSIKRVNSKEVRESLRIFNERNDLNFFDLGKIRPSLETRRAITLALVRSLLVEKGILSYEQAKKVEIHRLKSGKPFLKSPQIHQQVLPSLSISHSGSWIVCLLSDKKSPVGLDIEDLTVNRSYKKLSEYAFSKEENQFVSETEGIGFYQLWTAKEAIAKCNGKGLSYAMRMNLGNKLENYPSNQWKIVKVRNKEYEIYQQILEDSLVVTLARKQSLSE